MIKIFIYIGIFFCGLFAVAESKCAEAVTSNGTKNTHFAVEVSHQAATQVEAVIQSTIQTSRSKKGYAILVGTMIGSAALSTYLGSHLSPELQFTSVFLAQISTLGVYVLGAPIWEPLASKFRKWAFGISRTDFVGSISSQQLQTTWMKTQENYSINDQMSRNIISQFVIAVKENFYSAYRAYKENDPIYSADQVAEAAYRMRILFKDISPADPSVAAAVNAAFTNHISLNSEFRDLVWQRLRRFDADALGAEAQAYYQAVLNTWLKF